MPIAPDTEVRLIPNVPLIGYEHQMDFASESEQYNYFNSFSNKFIFTDFTYQRQEGSIKIPKSVDAIYSCNYVMFKNSSFSGKWFYGFITKKEYVNPTTCKVYFEIDAFQTWQFALNFKPSFVERQHMPRWDSSGNPITNTVDEGIDYGSEYETVSVQQWKPFDDVFFMVIVCKQRMDVNATAGEEVDPIINAGTQPLTYYVHPFKLNGVSVSEVTIDGTSQTISHLSTVLKALYKMENAVNNVAALYITENIGFNSLDFAMTEIEPVTIQDSTDTITTLRVRHVPVYEKVSGNFGDKYSGFSSVTESKLRMYPYTVTVVTDMKGNQIEVKNEFIRSPNLVIESKGSIGTSNKVSYNVANYLMTQAQLPEGDKAALQRALINNTPNDVPIITDMLSAYLQGNRNAIETQQDSIIWNQVTGAIGNAMTRSTMGTVNGLGNGYLAMQGLVAKQKDIDNVPPQVSNMGGNTAFDFGNGLTGIFIIKKEITAEYRTKLQNYFKMFGYKINDLRSINFKTRQHFDFIKTVGVSVYGNVPEEDMVKIREMFDNGVTIWHTSDVGNYSLANGEI